jgi:hypothetical protein
MRKAAKRWVISLIIVAGLILPQQGAGVGHIVVYASDTSSAGAPPPSTTATLNGSSTQAFGTNTYVLFSDVVAGTHTVEVATASGGYLPRESPDTPNAVNDPDSDYGTPRSITVPNNETVSRTFRFDPSINISATVRDTWTMDRLNGAAVEFTVNSGPNSGVKYTEYPWEANYASNWISDHAGNFPTNTILYVDDYDIKITCSGYQTYTASNVIANASAGDELDLGELFLVPNDSNTNQIDDLWEALYFGTGSNVVCEEDADADGVCNRDEYIAGTDPTNALSMLHLSHAFTNNAIELLWDTEPHRTYRLVGTTDLCTGTWVQVAGPWEASTNQTDMSWAETNMHLSWQSCYRVEVVPCTWTGTNQVLINTNWPTGGSGGGGTTNLPPLP